MKATVTILVMMASFVVSTAQSKKVKTTSQNPGQRSCKCPDKGFQCNLPARYHESTIYAGKHTNNILSSAYDFNLI